jgi:acyl-CoA reductase-like NAD-dependent aldehyde dehydrogenase
MTQANRKDVEIQAGNDETEAVRMLNSSPDGMATGVWNDMERSNRMAESLASGNSWIGSDSVFARRVPHGGENLSATGSGVPGPDTLIHYFREQSLVRPL